MPVIERVYLRYENKKKGWITGQRCFNLSDPIGKGQANQFGDVYLVQALFDWILREGGVFKGGAFHSGIVPASVNGSFNEATHRMILLYQQGGQWKIGRTVRADGITSGGVEKSYSSVRSNPNDYRPAQHGRRMGRWAGIRVRPRSGDVEQIPRLGSFAIDTTGGGRAKLVG